MDNDDDDFDLNDLEPQERDFLLLVRKLSDEDRVALLRAMQFSAANPEGGPHTEEELRKMLESLKRLN